MSYRYEQDRSALVGLLVGVVLVATILGVYHITQNGWLAAAAVTIIFFCVVGFSGDDR